MRHLDRAISETVPLAVTLREEISRIRDWARDRTRPASRAVPPVKFLSRFQRLERSRRAEEPERHAHRGTLPGHRAAGAPPRSRRRATSRGSPPPAEPPLQVRPRSDAQPFVRCPACGVDSPLGARRAPCGTALDTLEVVAFNADLWDRHREELARHEAAHTRTRNGGPRGRTPGTGGRPALGEALAREIAEREAGPAPQAPPRSSGALVLAVLALVLLPRGPLARRPSRLLVGALCVRVVIGRVRARPGEARPGGGSTVDR